MNIRPVAYSKPGGSWLQNKKEEGRDRGAGEVGRGGGELKQKNFKQKIHNQPRPSYNGSLPRDSKYSATVNLEKCTRTPNIFFRRCLFEKRIH